MNAEPRPLCLPYRYVLPQRVWFLLHFGLKMGVDFAYFGLNSGMVFEGKLECINVLILFEMNFKKSFCWC